MMVSMYFYKIGQKLEEDILFQISRIVEKILITYTLIIHQLIITIIGDFQIYIKKQNNMKEEKKNDIYYIIFNIIKIKY